MAGFLNSIVIAGGGTAGWLSAAYLAARHPQLEITLVEAPGIAPIGVGEGSWPTLRETLRTIGITEAEFLLRCDASFKQGSRFDGWTDGEADDRYFHPFTPPIPSSANPFAGTDMPFATASTPQVAICENDLAPKQGTMPDYAGALNYGYHFDATKLANLLKHHAIDRLGVRHLEDEIVDVNLDEKRMIDTLSLQRSGQIGADFFIDCTGLKALLIGRIDREGWIDRSAVSFNDSALAVSVPSPAGSPIASQTVGTAHQGGWIWDIALGTRRGIGCVYSSRFLSDNDASQILDTYLRGYCPDADVTTLKPRRITFPTGYRRKFWQGNCLAVGLSSGFIEPLEATAIVLIELSLQALADDLPESAELQEVLSHRFNRTFRMHWERVIDFLKLHYVLSDRQEPYWIAHRDPSTIPSSLRDQLLLWRERGPAERDMPLRQELFPAASQQYVFYGMMHTRGTSITRPTHNTHSEVERRARALRASLPSNRAFLDGLSSKAAGSSRPERLNA